MARQTTEAITFGRRAAPVCQHIGSSRMLSYRLKSLRHNFCKRLIAMGPSEQQERSVMDKWLKIGGVVSLYWFVSISMVFLNRYLLSNQDYKLEAPLFITLSQCLVAVVVFLVLMTVSKVKPDSVNFPPLELDLTILLKVLPVSVVFVGMITFNNLTLKFLGVAFYNVGRSLTTVFNVSLSYFVLGQTLSTRVVSCCAIIVSGFLLGLFEEESSVENLSFLGVLFGVSASFCVAMFSIMTKKLLPVVDNNIWRLQFYNNLNALPILLLLMLLLGEFPVLGAFPFWTSLYFWILLITSGLFGIAIGYVTSLQIQVTSPLTHNVSGTAKACAQTIIACVWFSEMKPGLWWLSNVMVLGGSSGYTYVRMIEMKAEKEQNKPLTVENGETKT